MFVSDRSLSASDPRAEPSGTKTSASGANTSASGAKTARLLPPPLSLAWGFNWPMTRIALAEVTPWTLRLVGYGVGMLFMFALVRLRGRDLALSVGPTRLHV